MTEPTIERVLVASTGHATRGDWKVLGAWTLDSNAPISIAWRDEGWFIYAGHPVEQYEGLSSSFVGLLNFAREHGAEWLLLDCDGTKYDQLPYFDEEEL